VSDFDLSVLIPARNERWLAETVRDVLKHSSKRTEVIIVLDGAWPEPDVALEQHPRVQVIYLAQSIGQRAATNMAARVSTSRYVMKLDAHCAMAPGFDEQLMKDAEELGPLCTQIPAQHNLHVFDWVCEKCGARLYQGPTPEACKLKDCGGKHTRQIVWDAVRRRTEAWCFDYDLKFGYWREFKKRPEAEAEIVDVMTSLGACFFMERERFFQLGGLDETHGSWGQFGVEIACKSWLSGGRHVVNKRTWFSHLFRTQGKDFGFPYPMHHEEQNHARHYSRQLWRGNQWPGQKLPLRWMIDKFWPIPGWTEEQREALPKELPKLQPSKGLAYYTDNRPDSKLLSAVQGQLLRASSGHPIVSVTLQATAFGQNIVLAEPRGVLAMFRQILTALQALDTDVAFLVEHDVLYAPEHFEFTPPRDDVYYYNTNVWHVNAETGEAVTYEAKRTSQLCANRLLLIEHYKKRVALVEQYGFTRAMGFEPGSHNRKERVDDVKSATWHTERPNIDIKHGKNLTPARWSPDQFRDKRNCKNWKVSDNVPGWGATLGRFPAFLDDIVKGA
jgi:glycosyltransferase involved in cell wall biosynthesis